MADTNTIPKPSMNDQLLNPIGEFQRLTQTLFLSPSGDQTARRVALPSVSSFIECDAEISRAWVSRERTKSNSGRSRLSNKIFSISWRLGSRSWKL